jgi:transposase
LSYKKSRLIPGKIPPVEVQQQFANFLYSMHDVAIQDDKQVLLFLDPMHQVHNNENDYSWQLKGKNNTKQIMANTGRRRMNIIGAINPITLSPTVIMTEQNCCEEVIHAFLIEVREQYKDAQTICIVLDNARYQRAYSVTELAKELNIDLVFLPPYCPNLNLIERVWKFFKKKVMKNKYYQSFSEFDQIVFDFFKCFDIYNEELKTLLNFKFGIIKAN